MWVTAWPYTAGRTRVVCFKQSCVTYSRRTTSLWSDATEPTHGTHIA